MSLYVAAWGAGTPGPIRQLEVDGQTVLIDNSDARFRIEVVDEFEDQPDQADLARKVFRSYTDAR